MRRYSLELTVALALGIVFVALAILAPGFYQAQPLLSLAAREAPTLVVVCGMALVIICRQIDISLGAQFSVCSVCAGLLASYHWPLAMVVLSSVLLGAFFGAANGVLVAGLGLPSIVVTPATMATCRESLRWWREGVWVDLPDHFQRLGLSQFRGQWMLILVALAVLVTLALSLRHLAAGRFIYAVGSDAEAARLAGIRPRWVTFGVFVAAGALTGLAAMMNVIQSPQVDPNSGTGLELKSIAAVVVGGVAISGGRGNLWGAFAGFLLLACIGPALTHLHVAPYWDKAIQGGVILLAVIVDGWRRRGRAR